MVAPSLSLIQGDGAVESSLDFPEIYASNNIDQYRASVPHFAALIDSCAQRCGQASGTNSSAAMAS